MNIKTKIARFLNKILMEIVKAPPQIFKAFYLNRLIHEESLESKIRGAIMPGRNIFVVGQAGEGKSCFLRNYIDNHTDIDIGYSKIITKQVHYLRIYFDEPEWDWSIADPRIIELIVLGLQKYFDEINSFPLDFDTSKNARSKFQLLIQHLNALEIDNRSSVLVALIDDIDHAPIEFQERFYSAIYPLLRSCGCVCVFAVRLPALLAAVRSTSGKLAATFSEFDTIKLTPIPIRQLTEHRIDALFKDRKLVEHFEEPDLQLKETEFAYLPSSKVDNFIQQYCNGNIREMSKMVIMIADHLEMLRQKNFSTDIGRTELINCLSIIGLFDIFGHKNDQGYSLTLSCVDLIRYQSIFNAQFIECITKLGFEGDVVRDEIRRLHENDIIEEIFVRDSYSKISGNNCSQAVEFELTNKGNLLITMSMWPQYEKQFSPPKKTISRDGPIFVSRITHEIIEFLKELVVIVQPKGPNVNVNWNSFCNAFRLFNGSLPPEKGRPGVTGFENKHFYNAIEKTGIIRKDLSSFPKYIVININDLHRKCRELGLDPTKQSPFIDEDFFIQRALDLLEE